MIIRYLIFKFHSNSVITPLLSYLKKFSHYYIIVSLFSNKDLTRNQFIVIIFLSRDTEYPNI